MSDEKKPVVLTIDTADDPDSPSFEDGWKLYSFANKKFTTDVDPDTYVDSYDSKTGVVTPANAKLKRKLKSGLAFWLSYFEHGQCVWSLKGEGGGDRFDSATLAGVLIWEQPVSNLGPKTPEDRRKDAEGFLRRYTDWCNGDVYLWAVTDPGEEIEGWIETYGFDETFEAIQEEVAGRPVVVRGDAAQMLLEGEGLNIVGEEALRVPEVRKYATASWAAADIKERVPRWTDQECEDWLADNEKYIRDAMITWGGEAIDDLLPAMPDDNDPGEGDGEEEEAKEA